jgi:hypothetical protein
MPAFALAALRNWKLIGIGLMALLLAVQTVRLSAAHNKIERREIDIRELRGELERISSKKNEQADATERNIRESEKRIQTSDKVAREIEAAPLPGNCATPPEILGADL